MIDTSQKHWQLWCIRCGWRFRSDQNTQPRRSCPCCHRQHMWVTTATSRAWKWPFDANMPLIMRREGMRGYLRLKGLRADPGQSLKRSRSPSPRRVRPQVRPTVLIPEIDVQLRWRTVQ